MSRSQRSGARSSGRWRAAVTGRAGRLVAVLAIAAFAQAATAALFDDEEARARIAETNQRLAQVQKQLEDRVAALEVKTAGIVEVAREIELLKSDMAKLRGQIEVLVHELGEAQKRQRDLYVDLDSRLRRIESAQAAAPAAAAGGPAMATAPGSEAASPGGAVMPNGAAAPGGAPAPGGAVSPAAGPAAGVAAGAARPVDAAAEQRTYDAALELFKRGDYPGAIAAFTSFVRAYPRGVLAPSAQYWIGNAHFARRDYRAAITAQRTLIANYQDSSKVPDALLNIASAQSELGDVAGARRTLEEIVAKHPQSEAAVKAKQRLSSR